jgi:hypothetical protein
MATSKNFHIASAGGGCKAFPPHLVPAAMGPKNWELV